MFDERPERPATSTHQTAHGSGCGWRYGQAQPGQGGIPSGCLTGMALLLAYQWQIHAAALLGMPHRTLFAKIKQYGTSAKPGVRAEFDGGG